jgi:hypothetical protein
VNPPTREPRPPVSFPHHARTRLVKAARSPLTTPLTELLAVQEVVTAQFGATVRVFRSFGRVRRARNNFEYPSSNSPGLTDDDIDDAIAVATRAHEAATAILDQDVLTRW